MWRKRSLRKCSIRKWQVVTKWIIPISFGGGHNSPPQGPEAPAQGVQQARARGRGVGGRRRVLGGRVGGRGGRRAGGCGGARLTRRPQARPVQVLHALRSEHLALITWKYSVFHFSEWKWNSQPSRLQSNACVSVALRAQIIIKILNSTFIIYIDTLGYSNTEHIKWMCNDGLITKSAYRHHQ